VQIDTQVILSEKKDIFLAFSGVNDHWVPEDKRLSERLLAEATEGNVATMTTNMRVLGYSANTGKWVEFE
jgi:hypothetical protein